MCNVHHKKKRKKKWQTGRWRTDTDPYFLIAIYDNSEWSLIHYDAEDMTANFDPNFKIQNRNSLQTFNGNIVHYILHAQLHTHRSLHNIYFENSFSNFVGFRLCIWRLHLCTERLYIWKLFFFSFHSFLAKTFTIIVYCVSMNVINRIIMFNEWEYFHLCIRYDSLIFWIIFDRSSFKSIVTDLLCGNLKNSYFRVMMINDRLHWFCQTLWLDSTKQLWHHTMWWLINNNVLNDIISSVSFQFDDICVILTSTKYSNLHEFCFTCYNLRLRSTGHNKLSIVLFFFFIYEFFVNVWELGDRWTLNASMSRFIINFAHQNENELVALITTAANK